MQTKPQLLQPSLCAAGSWTHSFVIRLTFPNLRIDEISLTFAVRASGISELKRIKVCGSFF